MATSVVPWRASELSDAPSASRRGSQIVLLVVSRISSLQQTTGRIVYKTQWRAVALCVAVMLRNVFVCSLLAWCAAFVCSRGSPLDSQPAETQRRAVFAAASTTWAITFIILVEFVVFAFRLLPHHFATYRSGRRPGLGYCVWRVARAVFIPHTVVHLLAAVVIALLCERLPQSVREWKLDYYLVCFFGMYHFAVCDAAVRWIYLTETVHGQARLQRESLGLAPSTARQRSTSSTRRYLAAFKHRSPMLVSLLVAGAYVNVAQHLAIAENSSYVTVFYIVSLVMKLTSQYLAKKFLINTHATNIQDMCIAVCAPTVLIDTQVRVIVLNAQTSSRVLVQNTMAMAGVEVIVRLGKALYVVYTIAQLKTKVRPLLTQQPATTQTNGDANQRGPLKEFELWREQQLALHTAETFVDMYAEYIAIGCASAIAFLYTNHPQYRVHSQGTTTELSSSSMMHPLVALLFQVTVELVVDYVACVMEMWHGVDVAKMRRLGAFLGFLFMMAAVVNVFITSVLYLK